MSFLAGILITSNCVRKKITRAFSVPDTPRPVMRNRVRPLRFQLLHAIVQEEVDQDGIHRRARVPPQYLASDELHAPHAAAAQLDFPSVSALDGSPLADVVV